MNKVSSLSDLIHESVRISPLEKAIIATDLFNRLHNVLQTSTLYLTFPSSRHSRFSHSIGCMHIAGRLFFNGICNAPRETLDGVLNHFEGFLLSVEQSETFVNEKNRLLDGMKGKHEDPFSKLNESVFSFSFYRSALPDRYRDLLDSNPNRHNLLTISYQAIRLAGMLHDVGHPPFSHVVENGLDELFEQILTIDQDIRNGSQKEFIKRIEKLKDYKPKYHEGIGLLLARHVIFNSIRNISAYWEPDTARQTAYNSLLAGHMALEVIRNDQQKTNFSALDSILRGPIDADRLDFVSRDRIMTALGRQALSTERLIQTFKIVKNPDFDADQTRSEYLFVPSATSLSTFEEVLERRFDFYRYAIGHHRVRKTDTLLKRIIMRLGAFELREARGRDDKLARGALPHNISGLWEAFSDYSRNGYVLVPDEFAMRASQWDDAWLITVLRGYRYVSHDIKEKLSEGDNEAEILTDMLDELLSGRKRYFSLWKRLDDFWSVEDSFIGEALSGSEQLQEDQQAETVGESHPRSQCDIWPHVVKMISQRRPDSGRRQGLIFSRIDHILTAAGELDNVLLQHVIDPAIQDLVSTRELRDGFATSVSINTGVKDSTLLALRDGRSVEIGQMSDIADRLLQRSRSIPPFYVYVSRGSGFTDQALVELREELGKLLWRHFAGKYRQAGALTQNPNPQ